VERNHIDAARHFLVASGRIKSSPRVKLRLLLPTMMVIVGSSACARAGGAVLFAEALVTKVKRSQSRPRRLVPLDVRFWPKADMSYCTAHVAF